MTLFMHVHKCGGSTVKHLLFQTGLRITPLNTLVGAFQLRHDLMMPVERDELTEEEFGSRFKFAFVRNPYDRIVSAWKYFQQARGWTGGFENFVAIAVDDTISYDRDSTLQASLDSPVHIRHHTRPLSHPGYLLDQMDFVGRHENFAAELRRVLPLIGVNDQMQIPVINRSEHAAYSDYFNASTRRVVADYYAEDLQRFCYEYEQGSG